MQGLAFFFLFIFAVNQLCDAREFTEDWTHFKQIKVKEAQEHEFSLLEEFSDKQATRCRPYIPDMDRHKGCRPFVENKVTLKDGTEMSASFINLNNSYRSFIASQAPLKQSIAQFWQMIFENQINQIVMLTELVEPKNLGRELAYPYWPQKIDEKMVLDNGLEITLIEEKELFSELKEKIQIRKLLLHAQGEDRLVMHYWYRHWMDDTAPSQPQTILALIQNVNAHNKSNAPLLVHCSAGAGRTGTFIALYHLQERDKLKDQKINFMDFVASLRWQRSYLLGMFPQYQFCSKFSP